MGDQQELLLLQEPEVIHQNPLEALPEYSSDPPDFSVLRLHSTPPAAAHRHHSQCSTCGCAGAAVNSRKRPSPAASLPAKKLFLDNPSPEHHLLLRRSASDPDPFRAAVAFPPPEDSPAPVAKPPAASPGGSASSRGGLPPRPPALRRAASDPIPSPPVAPKSLSRTSSSASDEVDKTPNSKTSKMLNHWRELNLWMEGFMRDEHSESENLTTTTTTTEDPNNENDNDDKDNNAENFAVNTSKEDSAELEESLSVERDGERLHIHFKCHCGKGYQFLLADGNCFYKLM